MTRFVEVEVGREHFTVQYSPQALIDAPIHIAERAIEQEESQFLLDNMANAVKSQVEVVFVTCSGPFEQLEDYRDQLRLVIGYPESDGPGRFCWQFELLCPECEGNGIAFTRGGRQIACPCCGETGHTHTFSVFTNGDGQFIDFPPRPVWSVAMGDFHDYDFEALPLVEALLATRDL